MLNFIELSFSSLLLYVFFLTLFLPAGSVALGRDKAKNIPLSFACSFLIYGLILSYAIFFSFSAKITQAVLIFTYILSFYLFFKNRQHETYLNKDSLYLFSYLFFYLLFLLSYAAFPTLNFRDISGAQTMMLSGLAIDNLIPYQASRFILEGYDPANVEVVKTWMFSDRGPLASVLNSVVFLILGLSERESFLWTSSGLAFVYQALMSFLNILSLVAVYLVSKELFSRKAAKISVLLLSTSYFYFLNTFYSWPKFFMAFFVLSGAYLFIKEKKLSAILFGLALLTHEISIFYLATFLLILLFRKDRSFKKLGIFLVVLFLVYSPWLYFKSLYPASPRGTYYFLFCYTGLDVNISFLEMLTTYFKERGSLGILKLSAINIFYPFDLGNLFFIPEHFVYFLDRVEHASFMQFLPAVGVFYFLIYLFSFDKKSLLNYWGLLTLVLVSILSGCLRGTINHVWCYPFYLVVFIYLGRAALKDSNFIKSLLFLGLTTQVFFLIFFLFNDKNILLHANSSYFLVQFALLSSLFLISYEK